MEIVNRLQVRNREELRRWFEANHRTADCCWVAVKRGRPEGSGTFWYLDAVEEALCFGWIDSTLKRTPDGQPLQRFTPRKAGSRWTELNKARFRRMERMGRMTDAGRAVFPDTEFVLPDDIRAALEAVPEAWRHFQEFPPLYRRIRVDNILRVRKNRELFEQRLARLIETATRGVTYGAWDDFGRLSE